MQPASPSSLFSIERVVGLLSPVFAAVSAMIVGWATKHVPGGLPINAAELTAAQATGAAGAFAMVWKWLHGRQLFTSAEQQAEAFARSSGTVLSDIGVTSSDVDRIEGFLKEHASEVESRIGDLAAKVEVVAHAPASVDEVVNQVLQRIFNQASQTPVATGAMTPPAAGTKVGDAGAPSQA